MITLDQMSAAVACCKYPGLAVTLHVNGPETQWSQWQAYLQVSCTDGECNTTGGAFPWMGRKWRLSQYMTHSEVVQTAFLAVLTTLEHEARERFTYRGRTIFDPHYDVEKLWSLRG